MKNTSLCTHQFFNRLFASLMLITASTAHGIEGNLVVATGKIGKNPQDQSDIVGRDLNVLGLGALGHVGLWTGDRVIEALNQNPTIVQNTLQDFKSRSSYWGAVYYPNWNKLPVVWLPSQIWIPYTNVVYSAKVAAVRRAVLIQQIGATYTMSPSIQVARVQECQGLRCTGPTPGKYRCDTFIKDAYLTAGVGGLSFGTTETPSTLWTTYSERLQ